MAHRVNVPGVGPVDFPDNMTDDQIVQAIKTHPSFKGKVQAQAPEMSLGQQAGDLAKSVGSGLVQGVEDLAGTPGLVESGAEWALTGGDTKRAPSILPTPDRVKKTVESVTGSTDYQPKTGAGEALKTVSEFIPGVFGGEVGTLAKMAKGVPEAAPALMKSLVKWGIVPGGADYAGGKVAKATGGSESIGELVGALTGMGGMTAINKLPGLTAKTLGDIQKSATDFYNAAKREGIAVQPDKLQRAADDLALDAYRMKSSPGRHKKVWEALTELHRVAGLHGGKPYAPVGAKGLHAAGIHGNPIDLEEIEAIRDDFSKAMHQAADPKERLVAGQLLGSFNNYTKNLTAADIVGGKSPAKALQYWRKADALWGVKKKVDTIDRIFHEAELDAAKAREAGTRETFREKLKGKLTALLKDDQEMKFWQPDEKKALEAAAKEGSSDKIVRFVGRMAAHAHLSWLNASGRQLQRYAMMGIPGAIRNAGAQSKFEILKNRLMGGTPPMRTPPPSAAYLGAAGGMAGNVGGPPGTTPSERGLYGGGQ